MVQASKSVVLISHVLVFFGDFNIIIGAHKYIGSFTLARIPIKDFKTWTYSNKLMHLPIKGVFFSWSNGIGGNAYTKKDWIELLLINFGWIIIL